MKSPYGTPWHKLTVYWRFDRLVEYCSFMSQPQVCKEISKEVVDTALELVSALNLSNPEWLDGQITNEADNRISLLLSRLTWPSGMVRERACVAIADLLIDSRWTKVIEKRLLEWMKPQTLESVVSIGLLIFLRAKMQDDKFVVPSMELILSCISKPSILSHILIDELFSREASPMNLAIMNSGSCPEDFQPDPFFTEYYTNFLPPIYADIAERIENEKGISFIRQWAFEWHKILENEGREPSASSLSYLYEQRYSDHTVVVDVELSEIYRSAYLRALAWTNMIEALSENEAIYLALETCPIDFGLWYLMPTSTPDWWPKVGKTEDTNGIASKIWEQVDILWEKQQTKNDIWVIVEASGIVYEGDIICDLRINGIFQKASKLLNHSLKDIDIDIDIGKFNNEIIYDPFGSGLIFEGIIAPDTNYINSSSSGREELPVAYLARPQPIPRWQFWRMFRGIWLPSPELSPQILTFKCSNDGVIVSDGYDIIAKWSDWRERIKEKATANLPPATGQCLLIKRKNIEDFSRNSGLLFCWICSLTSYQRKNNFQDYTISDDDCRIKTPYIGEEPTI